MVSTQSIVQLFNREEHAVLSALSDENFIVCFSAFLRTDAKASVLKAMMREIICQCISNVMMSRDVSVIDR